MFLPSTSFQTQCNNTFGINCNHNEVSHHSNFFTIISPTLLIKTMFWYSKNVGRISSLPQFLHVVVDHFYNYFFILEKKKKEWWLIKLMIDGRQAS
jgi:hypothetical protein